ncbi:MAG TPA: hypothetical protein VMV49_11765 [Candidatus Deferrimicrobium sp.]|nr:hypothetical protein [Candidatus Deferrimicrobium sp.]
MKHQEDTAKKIQEPFLPKITVSCQNSLLKFFKTLSKTESFILIDVKKMQERCVFAAEVEVKILKKMPKEEIISKEIKVAEIPDLLFFISKDYLRFFGNYTNLKLELQGRFNKRIACTNIPPFLTKTCGV